MSITPKIIFEEKIARALGNNPELAKAVNAIFQFDISGPEGGQWTLDLTKEKDWVTTGLAGTASMTIIVTDTDFMAVVSGKINGQMAFMSGKLRIKPMDIVLASKLSKVLATARG